MNFFSNAKEYFSLNNSPEIMGNLLHSKPEITYGARMIRRAVVQYNHLLRLEKCLSTNKYIIDISKLRDQIPASYYLLLSFNFYKNNKAYFPNVTCKYYNTNIQLIGKCLEHLINSNLPHHNGGRDLPFPIFLDSNFEISLDDNIDELYVNIMSEPYETINPFNSNNINRNNNYWLKYRRLIISHTIIDDLNDVTGYFKKFYIYIKNIDHVISVDLLINNIPVIQNVNPNHLKIQNELNYVSDNGNLLCVRLGFGDHGRALDHEKIELKLKLKDDVLAPLIRATIYGEIISLLGNYNSINYNNFNKINDKVNV